MAFIPSTHASGTRPHHFAFAAMTSLFFIWGFITALNDILIPHLKAAFSLSYTQAMLVQFCFFGAYFIVSPLAGKLIERIGYIRGIITGLCTIALGCALFYPAAEVAQYGLFLLGLFILAAGITILQVSANPYVAILGPQRTAASRLNLAQAINSAGHTLAPLFGAALIFGAVQADALVAKAVQLPYLLLAGVMLVTALGFCFLKLPVIEPETEQSLSLDDSIWRQRHLVLGAMAIFLYVGAEVSIGSFLVNYFGQAHIGGMSEHQAAQMVSYYWGGAMIGRFVGAALTRYIAPVYVLAFNALMAILLLLITVNATGNLAIWSVLAVGFFNSIMFPTIFTLAIRGLGPLTGRGSGLLCQAIVGGAILPVLQGVAADSASVQLSFLVPMVAYLYIGWYALFGATPLKVERRAEVGV
ncbi:sugar MFS transporter [Aliiglaciecola sp. CAU 1673]|uniref:sugar MFS transporter n=1 Tax=Aliiglaciecola sp. CAU 1673 TaxID=3032595 RepID=UPI0023DCBC3A|nr:sugar MFS transporter [Aliiglaciecola sp. CAU 1673]MDF2178610.1 sugar MFS transporter [Aliiglaciecola sp. CAU 1673]